MEREKWNKSILYLQFTYEQIEKDIKIYFFFYLKILILNKKNDFLCYIYIIQYIKNFNTTFHSYIFLFII